MNKSKKKTDIQIQCDERIVKKKEKKLVQLNEK